jgi:type I restriction enzyme S subunit
VTTPTAHYTEIGVRSYGRGLFLKPQVTGAELGSKRVFSIRSGDLVVSNVFAWEGAIAVAQPEHDDTIGSHRFMTLTPTADVSARFLQQYLLTQEGLAQVRAASPGSAGRNRTLSLRGLANLSVPVPDYAEQLRVGDAIEVADMTLEGIRARFSQNSPRDLAARLARLLSERLAATPAPRVATCE